MFRNYTPIAKVKSLLLCSRSIAKVKSYCQGQVLIATLELYCSALALLPCSCLGWHDSCIMPPIAKVKLGLLPSSSSPDECCKLHPVCVNVFHHCYLIGVPIWLARGKSECNSPLFNVTCAAKNLAVAFTIVTINVRRAVRVFTRDDMIQVITSPRGKPASPTTSALS